MQFAKSLALSFQSALLFLAAGYRQRRYMPMKIKSIIFLLIVLVIILTSGCGQPECTLVIYNATTEELAKEIKDYSLPEEILGNIMTRDSFNNLINQQSKEVILSIMDSNEVSCDSISLTNDSLICNSDGKIILFAINNISQVKVFYSDKTLTLLRNSAILETLTSSIGLLGYLPPNPPQPNWKSFVGLFGAGFILGIILDVNTSSYYCLISKKSFIKYFQERQKNIK